MTTLEQTTRRNGDDNEQINDEGTRDEDDGTRDAGDKTKQQSEMSYKPVHKLTSWDMVVRNNRATEMR